MDFDLTPEQELLRDSVATLGRRFGHEYFVSRAKAGEHSDELWAEAAKHGYLGVSLQAVLRFVAVALCPPLLAARLRRLRRSTPEQLA